MSATKVFFSLSLSLSKKKQIFLVTDGASFFQSKSFFPPILLQIAWHLPGNCLQSSAFKREKKISAQYLASQRKHHSSPFFFLFHEASLHLCLHLHHRVHLLRDQQAGGVRVAEVVDEDPVWAGLWGKSI